MKNKKYLVTGGSGFIGSNLVRRLIKEGCHVRILDDESRGSQDRLFDIVKDMEFLHGDIRDADTVRKACRGVDSMIHLAAVNGTEFFYTKPDLVLDVAVKGMVNVLDGCIKERVGEIFLASSSEVYQTPPTIPTDESVPLSIPDPLNPRYSYGAGKIISEMLAINYGRKFFDRVVIFRPHNVYGPNMGWEHVIPQFVLRMHALFRESSRKPILFPIQGSGRETRAFCFIDDFIDGFMVLKEKGKHLNIYNIGTEQETTVEQLAKDIARYLEADIEIKAGKLAEGGTTRRCPNLSKIKGLGYKPVKSIGEGIRITAPWYVENAIRAPQGRITLE